MNTSYLGRSLVLCIGIRDNTHVILIIKYNNKLHSRYDPRPTLRIVSAQRYVKHANKSISASNAKEGSNVFVGRERS